MSRRMKVLLVRCFLFVIILLASLVVVDIFILEPGQGLYRYNTDIDFNSGVLRKRFYYWIIPVKHEIVSTEFSEMIDTYCVTPKEAKWIEDVITVTVSGGWIKKGGGRVSSCSGISNAIAVADATANLTMEEKKYYLNKALDLLRENRIDDIWKLADEIGCLTQE